VALEPLYIHEEGVGIRGVVSHKVEALETDIFRANCNKPQGSKPGSIILFEPPSLPIPYYPDEGMVGRKIERGRDTIIQVCRQMGRWFGELIFRLECPALWQLLGTA